MSKSTGRISQIIGPVVDIHFDFGDGPKELPRIHEALSINRPGSRPQDVDRSMYALLTGMEADTVQTVKELGKRYPLYLLSNNNPISMVHIEQCFRENGIDPEHSFRDRFISCDMKLLKPSRAIYEETVRRVGLPAGEILFIDDNNSNVQAAQEAGLQARQYVPGTLLSTLLADL